ncbi:reverse transcriptase domain, reverse transcriptase zinc-binding domain protein [Tanacetum coccineum]
MAPDWLDRIPSLSSIHVPNLSVDCDAVLLWHDLNGNLRPFSVACAWDSLRSRADVVDWFHVVWFPQCIPRHVFHMWLVTKQKLKTQDRLRQWDVAPSTDLNLLRCPLCDLVPDSHSHLFFECPFSMQGKSVVSIISRLLLAATSYYIWIERNSRLFKKKASTVPHIVQVIASMVRLKLVTFKFKKVTTLSRLLLDQWKIPKGREKGWGKLLRDVAATMNKLTGKSHASNVVNPRKTVRVFSNPNSGYSSQQAHSDTNMGLDGTKGGDQVNLEVQTRNIGDKDASNVHNIDDVAKLFGVPLNTLKDIDDFVQDLQLGKHELWPLLSKEKGNEITDIVCNRYVVLSEFASMQKGALIVYDLSTKASPNADDNLSSKDSSSDPIVQSVDINTKSTSNAGAAGASTMAQPQVNSNFRPLVADPIFDGVNISIPRKVIKKRPPRCDDCKIFGHVHDHRPKKVVSSPIVTTFNVVSPTVEKSNDGFQTVGKKEKMKGKSKSTNELVIKGDLRKVVIIREVSSSSLFMGVFLQGGNLWGSAP